jgi:hypothetical protein
MTVKQLKEKIANLPDTMEVFVCGGKTEFTYGLLNSASVQRIRFHQIPEYEDCVAFQDVLVLDEE